MKLNKQVSRIFNYGIAEGEYRAKFKELETAGRITTKQIIQLLILLLEREEQRESDL